MKFTETTFTLNLPVHPQSKRHRPAEFDRPPNRRTSVFFLPFSDASENPIVSLFVRKKNWRKVRSSLSRSIVFWCFSVQKWIKIVQKVLQIVPQDSTGEVSAKSDGLEGGCEGIISL